MLVKKWYSDSVTFGLLFRHFVSAQLYL